MLGSFFLFLTLVPIPSSYLPVSCIKVLVPISALGRPILCIEGFLLLSRSHLVFWCLVLHWCPLGYNLNCPLLFSVYTVHDLLLHCSFVSVVFTPGSLINTNATTFVVNTYAIISSQNLFFQVPPVHYLSQPEQNPPGTKCHPGTQV